MSADSDSSQRRYALVVVVEATSADAAWEAVRGTAGALEGNGEPDCIYIGAPWQGIPGDAEDLSTERIALGMFVPGGSGFVARRRELRPCE